MNQKWTVELLQLLNEIDAHDYALSRILKCGRDAKAEGYGFNPLGCNFRNIALIYDSLHNTEKLRPRNVQTICRPMVYHVLVHIFMHSVPKFQQHPATFDKVFGILVGPILKVTIL